MKTTLICLLLALSAAWSMAEESLITTFGNHSYAEHGVVVEATESGEASVIIKLRFDLPGFKGAVGTGKNDPMKMLPGKWALQLVPPNELWIHDGLGQIRLMERTLSPSGFKTSSSDAVPELLTRAPEKLLQQMRALEAENNTTTALVKSWKVQNAKVKASLAKASFCVAYTLADEGDASPNSGKETPAAEKAPRISRRVLSQEHIVDVAALASLVVAQRQLKPTATQLLLDAALDRKGSYPIRECYDPHHVFVFYSSAGQPVGCIEVCFTCNRIRLVPGEAETTSWDGSMETAEMETLATVIVSAGLPLTPFKSLEDYRGSNRDQPTSPASSETKPASAK
ncbi:MAG TPA: hypothetical protein DCP71_10950 [Verrucomicrobiales bacterium]|nr:hypothetical protein [Verrucomicrobiales bacterium]